MHQMSVEILQQRFALAGAIQVEIVSAAVEMTMSSINCGFPSDSDNPIAFHPELADPHEEMWCKFLLTFRRCLNEMIVLICIDD